MQYGRLILAAINLHLISGLPLCGATSGEQTRQTVRRQHTCVRRGAASVQSRRYHKNLLCAEWAAQWCTEPPPLGILAKPLPHIPEVSDESPRGVLRC